MAPPPLLIDGLNVCFSYRSKSGRADLCTLLTVLIALAQHEVEFICVFDASARYKFEEDTRYFERLLSDLPNHFCEVPGGIRADDFVLQRADQEGSRVLSNDRFRDEAYKTRYPWLTSAADARLIKGAVIRDVVQVPGLDILEPLRTDVRAAVLDLINTLSGTTGQHPVVVNQDTAPTEADEAPPQARSPKVRVYEAARQLGINNRDLVACLQKLGVKAENHMSSIDLDAVERVKRLLARAVVAGGSGEEERGIRPTSVAPAREDDDSKRGRRG